MFGSCFGKCGKERVRSERTRQKLGMELRTNEERVFLFGKLCDLHENAVRRGAREDDARLSELLDIFRIDLVAMTVTFDDRRLSVRFRCVCTFLICAGYAPKRIDAP